MLCLSLNNNFCQTAVLPQMCLVLRHFDNTYSTAKSPIIHSAAQTPLVLLRIVDLNRFQIRGAVKAAYCI